ncbi:MAG: hypothetical protein ACE5GX_08685 [Thermoanaerobaculia bacterium]
MTRPVKLATILLILASSLAGSGSVQARMKRPQVGEAGTAAEDPAEEPEAQEIAAVAEDPSSYQAGKLRLEGVLDNLGKNFFTDLRVVLKDEDGSFLYVRPWLPTHLPPAPPGAGVERPEILTDYLGKRVALTATVQSGRLRSVGETFLLVVEGAEILKDPDD